MKLTSAFILFALYSFKTFASNFEPTIKFNFAAIASDDVHSVYGVIIPDPNREDEAIKLRAYKGSRIVQVISNNYQFEELIRGKSYVLIPLKKKKKNFAIIKLSINKIDNTIIDDIVWQSKYSYNTGSQKILSLEHADSAPKDIFIERRDYNLYSPISEPDLADKINTFVEFVRLTQAKLAFLTKLENINIEASNFNFLHNWIKDLENEIDTQIKSEKQKSAIPSLAEKNMSYYQNLINQIFLISSDLNLSANEKKSQKIYFESQALRKQIRDRFKQYKGL